MLREPMKPRCALCALLLASLCLLSLTGCHDETPPSESVPTVAALPTSPIAPPPVRPAAPPRPDKPTVFFGPPPQSPTKSVPKPKPTWEPKTLASAKKAKPITSAKLGKPANPPAKAKVIAKAKPFVHHARPLRKYRRVRGHRPFRRVRRVR